MLCEYVVAGSFISVFIKEMFKITLDAVKFEMAGGPSLMIKLPCPEMLEMNR